MYGAGWINSTKIKRMMNGTMASDGQVLKWIHTAKFWSSMQHNTGFASVITEGTQVPTL